MTRIVTFKKRLFCSLFPANSQFSLDPVSAFNQFGDVDTQVATLFHEEYGM
jgi:hypothetical protein